MHNFLHNLRAYTLYVYVFTYSYLLEIYAYLDIIYQG